jgi:hypothetical protein
VQEAITQALGQIIEQRPGNPVKTLGKLLIEAEEKREEGKMLAEIATMTGATGFDYIIVCCSNLAAENYWQARLEATVGEVTGAAAVVLCVHEDWDGGAGNGLGTLYAFQKAAAKASASGVDLMAAMKGGAAVALYHTAGKGTRLAPLPGAENNNKPGVKLPSLLQVGDDLQPITVLECVMRQTSSYAQARKGRCSVFWGDQIFVPSCGIAPSSFPADILAALRPMPTKAECAPRARASPPAVCRLARDGWMARRSLRQAERAACSARAEGAACGRQRPHDVADACADGRRRSCTSTALSPSTAAVRSPPRRRRAIRSRRTIAALCSLAIVCSSARGARRVVARALPTLCSDAFASWLCPFQAAPLSSRRSRTMWRWPTCRATSSAWARRSDPSPSQRR